MLTRHHIVSAALLAAIPAAAHAQGGEDETAELRAEVAALKARLAALEARLDRSAEEPRGDLAVRPEAAPAPALAIEMPVAEPASITRADNVLFAPLDQPVQNPNVRAAFQLTGSTSGKRAELLVSDTISATNFGGGSEGTGTFETVSLTASAPLSDDRPTNIGTFDGFDDGFAVKLRYTSYSSQLRRPTAATVRATQAQAKANCLQVEAASPNRDTLCNALPDPDYLRRYLGAEAFDLYQASFFGDAAWAWGLEAGLGHSVYKFLDPLTAAADKVTRQPFEAKLFGSVFSGQNSAISGSIAYQRTFKAATAAALCGAPTPPITKCPTGPVGKPTRKRAYLVSFGGRTYIPMDDFLVPGIGIAPTVTYDLKDDEFAVDLPFYLVPDKDGNLTGGIRLGYNTADDEVGIGVFVGSTFWLGQ